MDGPEPAVGHLLQIFLYEDILHLILYKIISLLKTKMFKLVSAPLLSKQGCLDTEQRFLKRFIISL